jgi:hypothetical protein
VRLIIGYPPGRLASAWLSERLGQQFVVESRAGAATNIATEAVVNAAPDGYTLLLAAPANATNVALFAKLNFDFIRDTAPVGALIRFPDVVVVNPAVPIHSIPEEVRGKSRRLSPVLQSQPTNVKSRGALEPRLRHKGEKCDRAFWAESAHHCATGDSLSPNAIGWSPATEPGKV